MCIQHPIVVGEDTPIALLLRELRRQDDRRIRCPTPSRPFVEPEWRSLQEAALCGHSEQQFSIFVKCGVASGHFLFSGSARRFKRSDLHGWNAAGVPSAYAAKGVPGAVRE